MGSLRNKKTILVSIGVCFLCLTGIFVGIMIPGITGSSVEAKGPTPVVVTNFAENVGYMVKDLWFAKELQEMLKNGNWEMGIEQILKLLGFGGTTKVAQNFYKSIEPNKYGVDAKKEWVKVVKDQDSGAYPILDSSQKTEEYSKQLAKYGTMVSLKMSATEEIGNLDIYNKLPVTEQNLVKGDVRQLDAMKRAFQSEMTSAVKMLDSVDQFEKFMQDTFDMNEIDTGTEKQAIKDLVKATVMNGAILLAILRTLNEERVNRLPFMARQMEEFQERIYSRVYLHSDK